MTERRRGAVAGFLGGAVACVAILVAVSLVVVYTGAYTVAATEDQASISRWALETMFQNSVERRAASLAPPSFTEPTIAVGAAKYKSTCQHCRDGPGVQRAEWASGMRPQPPHLREAAAKWTPQEIFWIAKHGVRMTGMPAFSPTHSDEKVWSVVAFVKQLPAMTPERYGSYAGGRAGNSHSEGSQSGPAPAARP